jgi:energy-coupling factor transporter transmembrane protein EcfT
MSGICAVQTPVSVLDDLPSDRRNGHLLVPIFISGFARLDVLSAAMYTCCCRGCRFRNKFRRMDARPFDRAMLALGVVWMVAEWWI